MDRKVAKLAHGAARAAFFANRVVVRARGGRPIDPDPLVRLVGIRWFARRFYSALVDAYGASYADVDETIGRIMSARPEAWVREWKRTAFRFESVGREAAASGHGATARSLLVRASIYYRFAEMAILEDSADREALGRRSLENYLLAGRFMEPSLERVTFPVGEETSAAYLRIPKGAVRPPVVLIVPGLGMLKEHGDFPQEILLERGLAAMTIDLPGQGENRGRFALNQENAQRLVGAAIDYLETRKDVAADRLGLLGTSMGASTALLFAASDRRPKALVEIAGFYYPSAWWDRFPKQIKEFLRYVAGARDDDELLALVRSVNLEGLVRQIACPLLVAHGMKDPIIPFEESNLIFDEAHEPKARITFEDGDHGCVNIGEARPLIADWLSDRLVRSSPAESPRIKMEAPVLLEGREAAGPPRSNAQGIIP